MNFRFTKMQGCGNDFLVLDDFSGHFTEFSIPEIRFLCDRHFGLGADGLVILQKGDGTDAKWLFYNCDGSEAEMCGNAARCVIQYLSENHFPGDDAITLQTLAGVIRGRVLEDGMVEVTLSSESQDSFELDDRILQIHGEPIQMYSLNTGVPHAVVEVKQLKGYPVAKIGAAILNHPAFEPEKTNVTFFQRLSGNRILSTTYERGVEQETLACGTGAAAAALVFSELYLESLPIEVQLPGGELIVDQSPVTKYLLLRGPAKSVGQVEVDEVDSDFVVPVGYGSQKKETP